MDDGGIEKGVEQQSLAITEWSAEIVTAEEAFKLGWSGMDTTTDAFEPGGGAVEMTPTHGSEAQDEVLLVANGKCKRCNQEGHIGRAQAHIRKKSCKAFTSTCQKCNLVGHFTSVCKRGGKKTKDPTSISQQVVDVEGASENSRTGEDDGVGDMHNCG